MVNLMRRYFVRRTSCMSATAVKCFAESRLYRTLSPCRPLSSPLMSVSINPTLSEMFSKNGRAKGLLRTVILKLGYCLASENVTGTSIATSPIAESRIISRCSVFMSCLFTCSSIVCWSRVQDWSMGHCTSSSAYTLSCTFCLPECLSEAGLLLCRGQFAARQAR